MDIFSCESQMTADSLVLGWEHPQMILSPTTFGLDMGPSDPNNNEPELGCPDTNIYLLFFKFSDVSKLITLFGIWRLQ